MVWKDILEKTCGYLGGKGVDEPCLDAELLIARLLGTGRGSLISALDKEATERQMEAMRRAMARLVTGEPIQYVLGEWDFRSLTLKCDRRALIPRPETEGLVTNVIAELSARKAARPGETPVVVDVGTGTGAIILSLAKEFTGQAAFLGTDVSEDAISLAKENAVKCGLTDRVKFVVMDGLDEFDEPQCVDVIVSNPPYVATSVCDTLDRKVRDFEPRLALDGGAKGLDFYERYLGDALNLLRSNGAVFFEIGDDQGEAVRGLMNGYGFEDIRIEKDLAGHDRYASARLK